MAPPVRATTSGSAQIINTDREIEIVKIWTEEELLAESDLTPQRRPDSRPRKLKRPQTDISPQASSSRPKRHARLPYRYRLRKEDVSTASKD